jgi:hypothetical protein
MTSNAVNAYLMPNRHDPDESKRQHQTEKREKRGKMKYRFLA